MKLARMGSAVLLSALALAACNDANAPSEARALVEGKP